MRPTVSASLYLGSSRIFETSYLLAFGDLYHHFQIWVMIIAGIKMFLRWDDVINVDIVNFLPK
jgi:hypothetical protein